MMESNENWKVFSAEEFKNIMSKKSDSRNEMESIEDIVSDIESQLQGNTGLDDPTKIDEAREQELEALREMQDQFTEEYAAAETESVEKSMELMEGLYGLVLDDVPEDDNFLKAKMNLDGMALSNITFQNNISKRAIFKLAMQIEVGEPHPRHFEVLAQLQRVLLDTSKYQADHIKDVFNNLREIKEIRMNKPEHVQTDKMKEEGLTVITSNKKQLMDSIKKLELNVVDMPKIDSKNPLLNDGKVSRSAHEMMGEKSAAESGFETEGFE